MSLLLDATQVLGYALLDFAWQGILLGVAAAVGLRLCRGRSAEARYAVASVALAAMLATPAITIALSWPTGSPAADRIEIARSPATATTPSVLGDARPSLNHLPSIGGRARIAPILPYVVLLWLAGVLLLLARLAGGLWLVRGLHARSLALAASRWQATAERCAARLGLRRVPHVVESAGVSSPSTVGWLRPVVLLPIAALANLSPFQVEAILAHELAHIRRNDYLVNLLQSLAETLLFFHPAVWWISRRIRLEREQCCDDVAVGLCGNPVDYAAALTELEAWRTERAVLAPGAVGGPLHRRVSRLLRTPPDHDPPRASGAVVGALAIALVAAFVQLSAGLGPTRAEAGVRSQAEEPIATPASFGWRVRPTAHFTIHYYGALEKQVPLADVAAEQAYQRVSAILGQTLTFQVPLVLFQTRRDFEQQTIAPAASLKWVNSFSEPARNRIVLLVDEGGDLYPRITHELTHIFMFQIVPRAGARTVPLWMDEGLAEYVAGVWTADELLELRQLVATGTVPSLSTLSPTGPPTSPDGGSPIRRAVLLGHAAFEFAQARYGEESIRRFPAALKRDVVDAAGDVYQGAFGTSPGEFDAAFRTYMERRFSKPD